MNFDDNAPFLEVQYCNLFQNQKSVRLLIRKGGKSNNSATKFVYYYSIMESFHLPHHSTTINNRDTKSWLISYKYKIFFSTIFPGECKAALGMEEGRIPDTAISASSSYEIKSVGPQNARWEADILKIPKMFFWGWIIFSIRVEHKKRICNK